MPYVWGVQARHLIGIFKHFKNKGSNFLTLLSAGQYDMHFVSFQHAVRGFASRVKPTRLSFVSRPTPTRCPRSRRSSSWNRKSRSCRSQRSTCYPRCQHRSASRCGVDADEGGESGMQWVTRYDYYRWALEGEPTPQKHG